MELDQSILSSYIFNLTEFSIAHEQAMLHILTGVWLSY